MAIEVWTAADLYNVRNNLSGDYIQMADIDLSGYSNWVPIPSVSGGSYNGQNYKIFNLKISSSAASLVGLFSATYSPYLMENIILENVSVVSTHRNTGALLGYLDLPRGSDLSIVRNCSVIGGSVASNTFEVGGLIGVSLTPSDCLTDSFTTCDVEGTDYVGGVTGWSYGMTKCRATGNISCEGESGGLTGANYKQVYSSEIRQCFATGNIISSGWGLLGGLVGWCEYGADIIDSYATGDVITTDPVAYGVGGLTGYIVDGSTIKNCYSKGFVSPTNVDTGGLIGYVDGVNYVINSYYDLETSGQGDTGKGEPRTTVDMTHPYNKSNTYRLWDFKDIWSISPRINDGYPVLRLLAAFNVWAKKKGTWNLSNDLLAKKAGLFNGFKGLSVKKGGVWRPV